MEQKDDFPGSSNLPEVSNENMEQNNDLSESSHVPDILEQNDDLPGSSSAQGLANVQEVMNETCEENAELPTVPESSNNTNENNDHQSDPFNSQEAFSETDEQNADISESNAQESLSEVIVQKGEFPETSNANDTSTSNKTDEREGDLPECTFEQAAVVGETIEQNSDLPCSSNVHKSEDETSDTENYLRKSSNGQGSLYDTDDDMPGSSYVKEIDLNISMTDIVRVAEDPERLARASLVFRPQVKLALSSTGLDKVRRQRIPDRPDNNMSLFSFLKSCVGKDVSKVPWPINFSEPLSLLQRMTEDFEYAYILDHAATLTDPCEKLAYVAVFTASTYSSVDIRITKPFNPLLGETYECDRKDDLGWKAISEQVSHHPPIAAQHCEGPNWICWQQYTTATKFRGKYLEVKPFGVSHLEFDNGGHYTWSKVKTTIYNIVIGKLWVDIHGIVELIDHSEGAKCTLTYYPHSYFNSEQYRLVKGIVQNKEGEVKWIIKGRWNEKFEMAAVLSVEGTEKHPEYETGTFETVWERHPPPEGSDKYYNLSVFACQLNEPEEGVAPTDSRNRPDQRLMEDGNWDEANEIKVRLEEKQREKRRERESMEEEAKSNGEDCPPYEPAWFRKETDPVTETEIHIFTGEYWNCKGRGDWSKCPDIFL